jgi:hypothetical protein
MSVLAQLSLCLQLPQSFSEHDFGAGTLFGLDKKCRKELTMPIETHNWTSDSAVRETDSRVKAFIIYEGVVAGKKAKETCDVLAASLGSDWALDLEMFSFDSLHMQRMREIASAAVSKADIIIFSCSRAGWPIDVLDWMESFLGMPDRPIALVALLARGSSPAGQPSKLESHLAGLAQRRGIQYFSQVDKRTAEDKGCRFMSESLKEANELDSAIKICE